MNTPQFSDGPPVPMIVEGLIDAATLRQLFADLEAATQILGIREKGTPGSYSLHEECTLETARDRLLTATARSVQVRYRYDNQEWTDTIFTRPGGFGVVRCRHTE